MPEIHTCYLPNSMALVFIGVYRLDQVKAQQRRHHRRRHHRTGG